MRVLVQAEDFDQGAEIAQFGRGRDVGAIVTFTGVVRDLPGDPLLHMDIEHYPGMTEKALSAIAKQAVGRWNLRDVLIIHRYGRLAPGARIMMVATASCHRADAFAAADFLMDYLKSRAPFWKKEVTPHGADWVDAKQSDEDALTRWS